MKNLILLLSIILPAVALATSDPEARIHDTETSRKAIHASTQAEIADLNYFRMKIRRVDVITSGFASDSKNLVSICKEATVALCRDRVDHLYSSIDEELARLNALGSSSSFARLVKSRFNQEIQIDGFLNKQRDRLTSLRASVLELRYQVGAVAAKAEFEAKQSAIDLNRSNLSREKVCSFGIPAAQTLYVSAMTDLKSAEPASDGFLIYRARKKVRDLSDRLNVIKQNCPAIDISKIQSLISSIDFAAWNKSIPQLFKKACTSIHSQDQSIQAVCKANIVNESTAYSLHVLLVRQGGVQ